MEHFTGVVKRGVLQPAEHRHVDGVLIFGPRGERRGKDRLFPACAVHQERFPESQLVLRQRARLVRAEHIHTRQLFDRGQSTDNGLLPGENARPHGHRDRQDRGQRHRHGGHGQNQGELERLHHRVAAKESDDQDEDHQDDRDNDEKIANLQDGLLKMADGVGFLDKLSSLAEVRLLSRGVDQSVDFALPHNRAGVHGLFRLPRRRQGFSRQGRLVHFDRVASQQFGVCRHDVANAQPYHVAGDEFAGRDRAPGAVAFDLRPQRQFFL